MFTIGYKKARKLNLEKMAQQYASIDDSYKPFELDGVQAYNPIYSRFFNMSPENYNLITLNQQYQAGDLKNLYDDASPSEKIKKDVFVKFSPLLDPLKFIMGKYDLKDPLTTALPQLDSEKCFKKIGNVNNCSYTDAFFSYLTNMMLETHGWVHGVAFYGSALAIQKRFRFNLADDYDFVKDCDFFANNIGKYYTLDKNAIIAMSQMAGSGSRTNRNKIQITDDACEIDAVDLGVDELLAHGVSAQVSDSNPFIEKTELELEYEKTPAANPESESSSDDSSESDSSVEEEDEELDNKNEDEEEDKKNDDEEDDEQLEKESDWETESEESDESYEAEEPLYCYLHDFPVQMILQEKCEGTFDELLMQNDIGPDELLAGLFQIVMMLLTYQKAFDFTHNDLHTNNIMYVYTEETHLCYKFENAYYKVPTYGRIYKLIDFGRAIYRYQNKMFCSDSFAPEGDAHSQYNCEPFMNEKKPRLEPNYSFDLCRLGCSMYDFIVDEEMAESGDHCINEAINVDKIIRHWCADDEDKNVVYKKSGQERYPNFKLYKMIARTVHRHTPKAQLESPVFAGFKHVGAFQKGESYMNIDDIPKYKNME
jgi:hypothetical protein